MLTAKSQEEANLEPNKLGSISLPENIEDILNDDTDEVK